MTSEGIGNNISSSNSNNNYNSLNHHQEETQKNFNDLFDSQQTSELTQTQFVDLDENEEDQSPSIRGPLSPFTPINPRKVPWGRLVPFQNEGGTSVEGNNETQIPSSLYPRDPTSTIGSITRSRSSSYHKTGGQYSNNDGVSPTMVMMEEGRQHPIKQLQEGEESGIAGPSNQTETGISFLGLHNLKPSDKFNEYIIGRSVKCDVVAPKRNSIPNNQTWVHAMVSNRHCSLFCMLKGETTSGTSSSSSSIDMDVFVEDTSGNGTLINNTTLLKRGQRRLLHTGDTISLINPATLRKKIRNTYDQSQILNHYTYIFVNVYQTNKGGWSAIVHNTAGRNIANDSCIQSSSCRNPENNLKSDTVEKENWRNILLKSPTPAHDASPTLSPKENMFSSAINNINAAIQTATSGKKRAAVDARATKKRSSPHDVHRHYNTYNPGVLSSSSSSSPNAGKKRRSSSSADRDGLSNTTNTHINATNRNTHNSTSANTQTHEKSPTKQTVRKQRFDEIYDLRDILGTGTCGEVRRAIHRQTGKVVAVKVISIGGTGNRNRMVAPNLEHAPDYSAIHAEAAILQSLNHPYIVKLYDVFLPTTLTYSTAETSVYLVMELLHGGDLFDRIVAKGQYTEVESRRVMRRLLASVHHLHQRGIVHRDLKPENILMVSRSDDIHVKLTDFGLAKSMTEDGLKTFCGTPQYFAPEVLKRQNTVAGNGRYDKKADMWSLGVILYILLSGTPPFDISRGFDSVAAANIVFHQSHWHNISSDAQDLVLGLLRKYPNERMSVQDACNHKWINLDDGDTHIYPLDDPALQFLSAENQRPEEKSDKQLQEITKKTKQISHGSTPIQNSIKSTPAPQCALNTPSPLNLHDGSTSKDRQSFVKRDLGLEYNMLESENVHMEGANKNDHHTFSPNQSANFPSPTTFLIAQQPNDNNLIADEALHKQNSSKTESLFSSVRQLSIEANMNKLNACSESNGLHNDGTLPNTTPRHSSDELLFGPEQKHPHPQSRKARDGQKESYSTPTRKNLSKKKNLFQSSGTGNSKESGCSENHNDGGKLQIQKVEDENNLDHVDSSTSMNNKSIDSDAKARQTTLSSFFKKKI